MKTTIFTVAASALLFGACSGAPGADPAPADANGATGAVKEVEEITIAVGIDVAGPMMDPADGRGAERDFFLANVYRSILRFDAQGEVQPDIASEYEVSPDGLTYTLTLRDDVTFHHGEPVTAEDVAFSLDRNRGVLPEVPNQTAAHYLQAIESVTVDDATTVTLQLSEPDPLLLRALAWKTGMVVPKAYLDEVGLEGFHKEPIGAGPYKFVSQAIGQETQITKFDDYNGSDPGTIRDVTLKVVPERSSRVSQLQAGDVDFVFGLDPSQVEQVENAGLNVVGTPSGQNMWLMIDKRFKEFESVEVRQALQYAIDREAIVDSLYSGMAQPIASLDTSAVTTDPDLLPYEFDPEKAKALLEESGVDLTREIPFTVPIGRYPMGEEASLAIQSNLEDVGLNVALKRVEYGTWVDQLIDKSLSGMSYGDIPNTIFDPLRAQPPNVGCEGSYSLWCDETLDSMNAEADDASGDERTERIREYHDYMHDNPPGVFLWQTYSISGMNQDFDWTPREGIAHFLMADISAQ